MKRWQFGAVLATLIVLVAISIWQWRTQAAGTVRIVDAPTRVIESAAINVQQPSVQQNSAVTPPMATIAAPAPEFYRDIKPILDQRCVACHSGSDAPCHLNLDSVVGIHRDEASAQAHSSLLYQMLKLKAEHPLPAGSLPAAFDIAATRKAFCPTIESFAHYAKERPLEGMPFGLPALSSDEYATITQWLETGATVAPAPPLSAFAQKASSHWEQFLNRGDLKSQLMARYLYEHLFRADLYFENDTAREFFKLVRSRTPPGTPLDIIATERPYDDPGVPRVYYRLQLYRATIVAKTHLPYTLSAHRMQRWQQLFLQSDYAVTQLPSYTPDVAANPFIAFAAIPVQSRYRFLLDDTNYFMSTFVNGSIRRSAPALEAMEDKFWVLFANPDNAVAVDGDFLARESNNMRLSGTFDKQPLTYAKWKKYADLQAHYLVAKDAYLKQKFPQSQAATLDLLWDGGGDNQNAALTIFRHADSASVVPGFVGALPKTAWVIDYPMLERFYYLLVADADAYGDTNQQTLPRLYMDFLRMEGETNFLDFLPKAARDKTRNSWYRGVSAKLRTSVYRQTAAYRRASGIHYRSKNPQREFFDLVAARLGAALSHRYDLAEAKLAPSTQTAMTNIARLHGSAIASLPETILLRIIIRNEPDRVFTLIHNDDRSNVSALLIEHARRRSWRDILSVLPGIVGAYPNAFWVVSEDDLPRFAHDFAAVRGPNGYRALAARVAVARNSTKFWQESDWVLNTYRNLEPIEWGILDYSRYQR